MKRATADGHDPRVDVVQAARSFLFVPGDRPERFDKAAAAGADVVLIDLEDAVGAEHKAVAREAAVAWLIAGGEAGVRVNASDSPEHEADVEALAGLETMVAVMLPKAIDATAASNVAARTGAPVVGLVESAAGMAGVQALAEADGLVRLAFGHLDYAVDVGADEGQTAMLHARSTLVLACRAASQPGPVDGVTVTLDDPQALAEDLAHARDIGLTGKLLIHPRQVEATHAAYRPCEADVAWAEEILAAVHCTSAGAVKVDGEMVDAPVIARAEALLRRKDR